MPAGVPLKPGLRIAFMIVVILSTLSFFAAVGLWTGAAIMASGGNDNPTSDAMAGAGAGSIGLAVLLVYVQIGLGVAWMHRAWSWLPPEERWSRHWRSWITPGTASLFLLVPYFHYYWMFVINTALCDALDRVRARFPIRAAAPRGVVLAAEICQFIIPLPVAAILWLVYITRVERMMAELAASPVPR